MFNISFEFDEVKKTISNVKITEKKPKEQLTGAYVSLSDNKLTFTDDAIQLLEVSPGDRITINYYTESEENTFPVIGKSSLFTDDEGGNKLTKQNTISFRGSQKKILKEYGSNFKLEPFKNMFKLIEHKTAVDKELTDLENFVNLFDEINLSE